MELYNETKIILLFLSEKLLFLSDVIYSVECFAKTNKDPKHICFLLLNEFLI